MNNRIVLAYCGDPESSNVIPQLARDHDADVIAVALDLGNGPPLGELRDAALAAGATRCHALDLREEFARECIVPALRAGVFADADAAIASFAHDFVARKLADIAEIEQAAVVPLDLEFESKRATPAARAAGPADLEIQFADGTPVAINGVPMTLTELMESVETISGTRAIDVLTLGYQQLGDASDGRISLRVHPAWHGDSSREPTVVAV
jgi:argininosuccinate synthase